jgi:hypothetical protein
MRNQSSRILISGPIDLDETDLGFSIQLFNAESARTNSQTNTNRKDVPTFGADESILTPISGSRNIRLQGQTSFQKISGAFPSSGVKESVRRWIRKLEALVLPQQGLGWKVNDYERGVTYQPVDGTDTDKKRGLLISDVEWEFNPEEAGTVSWSIDGEYSEGVQEALDPQSEYINNYPLLDFDQDQLTVGGETIDLSYVENRRVDRTVDINNTELLFQLEDSFGDSPLVGFLESGVTADVSFTGTVYDANSFESTVQLFDGGIQGETAVLTDSFAGRNWSGTISDSSSTIEAGRPNRFDFELTLEVGNVIS